MRSFKQFPYFNIKAESTGRTRKGIAAVFGNIDAAGDRIIPGAFAETIKNNRGRVKHLWNHDFSTPPIASIVELKEVGREDLPQEVLDYAPEATGGLLVSREYYKNELADWVLQAIDKGDVSEMSFGYDVLRYEEVKEERDGTELRIRELKELRLYDTSDVNWGCNAATVAAGAKNLMPLGALMQQLQAYAEDMKAGRRNASSDEQLINMIHRAALDLGCTECAGLADSEETPKSEIAGAVLIDTSHLAARLRLQRLKSEFLTI